MITSTQLGDVLWHKKLIFWNFIVLFIIKSLFSYWSGKVADIANSGQPFPHQKIVAETNAARIKLGLTPLIANSTLEQAAAAKLQDMVSGQYFAHFSPNGTSPWHWLKLQQYNYSHAGENLAIGFPTATDTVTAWLQSPEHKANLLNRNYRDIGVATAQVNLQGMNGVLVVQLFGTPGPTVSPVTTNKEAAIQPKTIEQTQIAKSIQTFRASKAHGGAVKAAHVANTSFIVYSFILYLFSTGWLILKGWRRELLFKTGLNLALVILALIVPIIELTRPAFIF